MVYSSSCQGESRTSGPCDGAEQRPAETLWKRDVQAAWITLAFPLLGCKGSCCELQDMLIQALAIGDLVKMELYQIQSKILTIFQPSECVAVWAKVPKLCNLC